MGGILMENFIEKIDEKKIKDLKKLSEELVKTIFSVHVHNEEICLSIGQKLKGTKEFFEEIDRQKALFLEPHKNFINAINERFKTITEPMEKAIEVVKNKLEIFRMAEVAKAQETCEKMKKDFEEGEEMKNYRNIIKRMDCILDQILAKMFGGEYKVFSSGEKKQLPGCLETEDFKTLANWLNEKYPKPEEFAIFSDVSISIKTESIKCIEKMIKDFSKMSSEQINDEKAKILKKFETLQNTATNVFLTWQKKKIKEADDIVKKAKNDQIRTKYTFTINNPLLIPDGLKSPDEKKIKAFMKENSELIKEGTMKEIPGITFEAVQYYVNNI